MNICDYFFIRYRMSSKANNCAPQKFGKDLFWKHAVKDGWE